MVVLDIKTKCIVALGIFIAIIMLIFLWRNTAIKLANTEQKLTEVTCALDTVTKENTRLVEYNKARDTEIKKLEKQYQTKLNAIPADLCGDMKPSKELIEYFKKGE